MAINQALRDPVLVNDWHPVGWSKSVVTGSVSASHLLDTPLAIWRDSVGLVHVWEDRCPHRGTKLSIGTQQGDTVRCAYHGWTFGTDGKCRHIPALPNLTKASMKACATSFSVQERYGLIWVCLGTPALYLPKFPEFDDERLTKVGCGSYEVSSSAPRIVENFLDMAHFSFVHAGILGTEEQAEIVDYEVTHFDNAPWGQGILATGCRAWQPQASAAATGGSHVEYGYRVPRSLCAILTKQTTIGPQEAIALFLQPLTEVTTRVWIILALGDHESGEQALREFQDRIFQQDKPILESQSPARLPLAPGAEVSVVCDRLSLAYRDYLRGVSLRYGVLCAVGELEFKQKESP